MCLKVGNKITNKSGTAEEKITFVSCILAGDVFCCLQAERNGFKYENFIFNTRMSEL